jgi:hypothetical protein
MYAAKDWQADAAAEGRLSAIDPAPASSDGRRR